jgi:hypothetical protein
VSTRLPNAAIDRLSSDVDPASLRRMRIVAERPWCWLPVLLRTGATTFAPFVFFRPGRYDTTTPRGLALIAHEAGHVTQASETGLPRFLLRYAIGNLRCGFRHDRHPMEVPMIALQRRVRSALESGPKP